MLLYDKRKDTLLSRCPSSFTFSILFRDLKPENIGIDPFGIVKIFDFGLAKELKLCDQVRPDLYRATRLIGTRRYMAPEVFYGPQYGLPSDVYSFSILLWQVIALKTPYCNMDIIEHVRFAFKKKRRPKLEKHWPKPISTLIKTGWSHKPKRRPKIGQIHEEIKEYLISTQDIEIDEC
jgi:serine/threonine protein kinase